MHAQEEGRLTHLVEPRVSVLQCEVHLLGHPARSGGTAGTRVTTSLCVPHRVGGVSTLRADPRNGVRGQATSVENGSVGLRGVKQR